MDKGRVEEEGEIEIEKEMRESFRFFCFGYSSFGNEMTPIHEIM